VEIQEVQVDIAADGAVQISVRGVKGPGCLALTQAVEEQLGGQVLLRELSAEHEEDVDLADQASQDLRPGW
jgi:hypothetical protein